MGMAGALAVLPRPAAAQVLAGSEFQVNVATTAAQQRPSIAVQANGDFVVVYESDAADGSYIGVVGRRFDATGARKEAEVQAGRVLLDGPGDVGVEDEVVRDRRRLSAEGVVVPILLLDRDTGQVEKSPHIVTRGAFDPGGEGELLLEAEQVLIQELESRPREERHDLLLIKERVRLCLRRFFKRRTQRRPMVIPVVMEV